MEIFCRGKETTSSFAAAFASPMYLRSSSLSIPENFVLNLSFTLERSLSQTPLGRFSDSYILSRRSLAAASWARASSVRALYDEYDSPRTSSARALSLIRLRSLATVGSFFSPSIIKWANSSGRTSSPLLPWAILMSSAMPSPSLSAFEKSATPFLPSARSRELSAPTDIPFAPRKSLIFLLRLYAAVIFCAEAWFSGVVFSTETYIPLLSVLLTTAT